MADRYVLIIDDDDAFRERLAAALPAEGVRLVCTTEGDDEALALLTRHRPAMVFIAVDLPDKEGFALFSKIKKASRNVFVALTTSSVSKADLKMHEKLRVHAEAYLHKDDLTDDALRKMLDARGFVADAPPEPVASDDPADDSSEETHGDTGTDDEPSESKREPAAPTKNVRSEDADFDPRLHKYLDPETAAIFAEIEEDAAQLLTENASAPGDVTPARVKDLEQQVARLEDQLSQTQRDARSSPFSSEFLNLREVVNQKDEEIDELKASLARRDGYVLVVKRKLAEVARRLEEAQTERDRSLEEATDMNARLATAEKKLAGVARELDDQQKLHDREVDELKEALSEEQVRVTVTRHELEAEIAELRKEKTQLVQDSEQTHSQALKQLETILRAEKATALAEQREKYAGKLKEVEDTRARMLHELREENEKALEVMQDGHREALERASAEAQETMRQMAEQSAAALKQSNEQRVRELELAEKKRAADLEEAEKRHGAKIEAFIGKHAAERDELRQQAESAVKANDRMLDEVNEKVQDVLKSWEDERTKHHETRERYERELAEIQSAHTKHLEQAEQDQFSALAGLSKKFREERSRSIEAERQRGNERLQELAKQHAAALAARDQRLEEELESLRAAHQHALVTKEREAEQRIAEAVERATLTLANEHEEAKRQHANELASLRQSKEHELQSLSSAHMEALANRDQSLQQAVREAVEQVKSDGADQLEQIHHEHEQAVHSLRKEYEEELTTLEETHRTMIAQQETTARAALKAVEDERDESGVVIDSLRAEIAEMAAQHRSTFTVADERHKAELRELQKEFKAKTAQLDDEKQFLAASIEKLKRQSGSELERATTSLAHEKQLHQATRDRYERRVTELKSRHTDGLKRVENDWMTKLEHLEQSLNERSEKGAAEAAKDADTKIARMRAQHESAVASLRKEFELELAAATRKLEQAQGFEESYQDAARELTELKNRLEALDADFLDARTKLAAREDLVERYEKKIEENTDTINSLKAVINDFSRSVDGYLQDRTDQDETISSLKAVIDDMYRSIDEKEEPH